MATTMVGMDTNSTVGDPGRSAAEQAADHGRTESLSSDREASFAERPRNEGTDGVNKASPLVPPFVTPSSVAAATDEGYSGLRSRSRSRRRPAFAFVLIAGLLLGLRAVHGQEGGAPEAASNKKCPVMTEEDVDPAVYTDYQGVRVYFCCGKCRKKFLATPALYTANVPQLVQQAPVPTDDASTQAGTPAPRGAGVPPASEGEHAAPEDHTPGETGQDRIEGVPRLLRFLGKFHPVVVHFPIALVLAAVLAEAMAMKTGNPGWEGAGRFCLVIGALSALLVVPLGWAAAAYSPFPDEMEGALFAHRWAGTLTGILILGLALCSSKRPAPGTRGIVVYRVFLFASGAFVALTAHYGGLLTLGLDHFDW